MGIQPLETHSIFQVTLLCGHLGGPCLLTSEMGTSILVFGKM